MQLLRFLTAGSVDDGKSTLIGRMLYDCNALLRDQIEILEDPNKRLPDGSPNFALLTDGLRAEREQGITIDVAYKYFNTSKRKFIIADAPGHVQYTRNMITGASTADLVIILIDARHGVLEQTHRHSYISNLVQIPHLVVAINKMDLVGYSQDVFESIKAQYNAFAAKLNIQDITFIPVSAQLGDNVVNRGENMPWYKGETLLTHLENVHTESDQNLEDARLPVQYVIRPQTKELPDYRGYAGQLESGIFAVGDAVTILPGGAKTVITGIEYKQQSVQQAFAPQSITLLLKDNVDISRGDLIVPSDNIPHCAKDLEVWVNWMNTEPLQTGQKLLLQQGPRTVRAIVKEILHKVDVNTFEKISAQGSLELNDIARIRIRTASEVYFDDYRRNKGMGSFILIDETTNLTAGAGFMYDSGHSGGFWENEFEHGEGI
jgi:sulfate adenylyltransferase subunit 1